MTNEPLAAAHRQIGNAEHSVERHLLEAADDLERADVASDPVGLRQGAEKLSEHAERHLREAERLEGRPGR